jgi:hypothetical protein
MIARPTTCSKCGADVFWVQRDPRRAPVMDASGTFRGWRQYQPEGTYCDIDLDAFSERDFYRRHQCAATRRRPRAGDYIPPVQRKAIERRRAKASEAMPVAQAIPAKKLLETLGE